MIALDPEGGNIGGQRDGGGEETRAGKWVLGNLAGSNKKKLYDAKRQCGQVEGWSGFRGVFGVCPRHASSKRAAGFDAGWIL